MNIQNLPLTELKPYPKNCKKHSASQIEKLARSITEYGFTQPIVIDKDNFIIAGHGRYEAAKKLNLETTPTVKLDLSPAQTKALRIADNRLSIAPWDEDVLKEELLSLKGVYDLTLTGLDEAEFGKLLKEDADPEDFDVDTAYQNPKYNIQPGEHWLLGEHHLICGDSTDAGVVDNFLKDVKIDSIVTDPPYGVDYGVNPIDEKNIKHPPIKNDESIQDYTQFTTNWLQPTLHHLNDYNTIYIFGTAKLFEIFTAWRDNNITISTPLVWVKNRIVLARTDYLPQREFIIYGWYGKHKFYGNHPSTNLMHDRPNRSTNHPTMKPVNLITDLVSHGSPYNGTIYEPFAGSGTTLIASHITGRKCYNLEIDPVYCSVIIERWEKLTSKKAVKLS